MNGLFRRLYESTQWGQRWRQERERKDLERERRQRAADYPGHLQCIARSGETGSSEPNPELLASLKAVADAGNAPLTEEAYNHASLDGHPDLSNATRIAYLIVNDPLHPNHKHAVLRTQAQRALDALTSSFESSRSLVKRLEAGRRNGAQNH